MSIVLYSSSVSTPFAKELSMCHFLKFYGQDGQFVSWFVCCNVPINQPIMNSMSVCLLTNFIKSHVSLSLSTQAFTKYITVLEWKAILSLFQGGLNQGQLKLVVET